MKSKLQEWTRPSGKWTDIIIVAGILSYILEISGDLLGEMLVKVIPLKKFFGLFTASDAVIEHMFLYLVFIGVWIVFFLACGIIKWNRPILKQAAPNKNGNNVKGILIGLLLGFATNGFCILIAALMGDIHLSFNEFNPVILVIFLIVVLIQSGAEEIMDRAYLYQKLRRRYKNPVVAVVGNAVMFSVVHLFNPGITVMAVINILVIGMVFSLLVYYYDALWVAIMWHAGWNFTQNILFGLPNSGIVSEYSLFKMDAANAVNGLFYDVKFGVEGSIGALVFLIILLVVLILVNRGKTEKVDVWSDTWQA